jgi:hypothetical protein
MNHRQRHVLETLRQVHDSGDITRRGEKARQRTFGKTAAVVARIEERG